MQCILLGVGVGSAAHLWSASPRPTNRPPMTDYHQYHVFMNNMCNIKETCQMDNGKQCDSAISWKHAQYKSDMKK